jgi:hypothetical protein
MSFKCKHPPYPPLFPENIDCHRGYGWRVTLHRFCACFSQKADAHRDAGGGSVFGEISTFAERNSGGFLVK